VLFLQQAVADHERGSGLQPQRRLRRLVVVRLLDERSDEHVDILHRLRGNRSRPRQHVPRDLASGGVRNLTDLRQQLRNDPSQNSIIASGLGSTGDLLPPLKNDHGHVVTDTRRTSVWG